MRFSTEVIRAFVRGQRKYVPCAGPGCLLCVAHRRSEPHTVSAPVPGAWDELQATRNAEAARAQTCGVDPVLAMEDDGGAVTPA